MGKILSCAIAVVVALTVVCCNSSGCLDNQNSIPLAGFYSMETKGKVSVRDINIGGVGAPGDTLLLRGVAANQVYLPFRAADNSTAFYFHLVTDADTLGIDTGLNDTISFRYESIPYFASADCGAMYHYRITECSHTTLFIDSVAVTDSLITNVDMQRIEIYFHDDDDDADDPESEIEI